MMLDKVNIYQDAKVFKQIDFEIMLKKEKIRTNEQAIAKAYKLAGINGPTGYDNMGIDYSRVTSSTPAAHIGLDDAIRMAEPYQKQNDNLQKEISSLKNRKKVLLKTLNTLGGIENKIFLHRVIMDETQEEAADEIGLSRRHLQRIEKQMKHTSIFDL
jgi:hypothetical protein